MLYLNEPVIDHSNYNNYMNPVVNGERVHRGLIPRDYSKHPQGCYKSAPALAVDFPLIPRSEWSARIKEMEEQKSRISDIMLAHNVPCLDQNGQGYCWAYSTTGCVQALRALANQPTVMLSAHAVACIVKGFQDEGGWSALSLDFLMARGVPSVEVWPEKSMSRSHDKPATWENAALHKVTEGWVDLAAAVYDRQLTFDQVMTCLLSRIPVAGDFNFWGHAIMLADPVEVEPGSFGVRLRNSWTASWGANGFGVLRGSEAIPDGAVALRVTGAAAA